MPQTFKIGVSEKLDDTYNVAQSKKRVSELEFWNTVEIKIKELTANQPNKYEETLTKAKDALTKGTLTVGGTFFEVNGRQATNKSLNLIKPK